MSSLILKTENLSKAFGKKTVVDRFSFELHSNEVIGILGVNGAGKTTLMHMLLGLIKPTSGSINIFGCELEKHRIALLKRMNFSSAYTDLPGNLSVWQNLIIFAKLYNVKKPERKIEALMERFEISAFKNSSTGDLSSGEKARVNLCKAFINDPELLLLDEPTASLDPDIAEKVRQMIQQTQLERRIAILYTSHNMKDIEALCKKIVFIHNGKNFMEGTPTEIKEHFKQESLEDVFIHLARDNTIDKR